MLFHPLCRQVRSALVQHQRYRLPLTVGLEGNLRVDDLQEKILVAFRKHLEFWLAGGLREELIALPRDRQDEVRSQLVASQVTVEQFRIDGSLLVLLRWLERALRKERSLRIQQMQTDIIYSCGRLGI